MTELDYHARYDSAESDYKLYIHTVYCIGYSTEWMLFVLVIFQIRTNVVQKPQLFAKLCKTGPCLIC